MRPMLSPTLRPYSFRFRSLLSLALQPQSLVKTQDRHIGPTSHVRSLVCRSRLFATFARFDRQLTPHSPLATQPVRHLLTATQTRHRSIRHTPSALSLRHSVVDHCRSPAVPDAFQHDRPSLTPCSMARAVLQRRASGRRVLFPYSLYHAHCSTCFCLSFLVPLTLV